MIDKSYLKKVSALEDSSHTLRDVFRAFTVGGGICVFGQLLSALYFYFTSSQTLASCLVTVTLIFLSCLFTGLGWYDTLAKFAGAGTLVPITGFANAVSSPAIDSKSEGFILGIGAKMFTIAGPVIVYGTVASVVYGLIYWVTTLF